MRIIELTKEVRQDILNDLLKRSPNNYSQYESVVNDIIENVKAKGDRAVFDYTLQFDKYALTPENIRVTRQEIEDAYTKLDAGLVQAIRKSAENIRAFHARQLRNSWFDAKEDGTILGMKITPIARAGVYVPGGKAAYPSSVLMNVIPARVAGVDSSRGRRTGQSRHPCCGGHRGSGYHLQGGRRPGHCRSCLWHGVRSQGG